MYKTLIFLACLCFSGTAYANEEAGSAVVHPVFYTLNISVEGYTVVNNNKTLTPPITVVPPYRLFQSSITPTLIQHDASVPPELLLARLTKQIDDQLDRPKKSKKIKTPSP